MYILILIGLLAIVYFGIGLVKSYLKIGASSSLSAELFFGEGGIYVNDELLGPLPYNSDEITAGDNKVTVKGNGVEYEVSLNFAPNSEVVLKRDLGVSQSFSGGQNFWLETADSDIILSVISEPKGAEVLIDGTRVGSTPYSSSDLVPGDYELQVSLPGYESQKARIEVTNGYRLNSSVSLFPIPVPEKISLLEGSAKLYDVFSDTLVVTSSPEAWVDAVIYWNQTRGVNLSGVGVNKNLVFDYFLDSEGNVYTKNGTKVALDVTDFVADAERGAYLRKVSDGEGLSEKAKETFLALGEVEGAGAQKATILTTGVGWLRVRSEPTLNGVEVTRVNVGDTFDVLEEGDEWVKIKISEDTEGWVYSSYVSIE